MSTLILNPNSIYKNSQANFVLNKDALYTFTRSVSAINDSVYGMQPTRQQLLSGFSLSDIYAVNPKDTNFSLCATVDKLQDSLSVAGISLSALKFFATRPFEVYDSISVMQAEAKNPLAVYLTPIFATEKGEISVFQLDFDGTIKNLRPSEIEEWKQEVPQPEPWWEDQHWHFLSTDGTEEYEVETTDHYEWIYVLPNTISSWEQMEEIYKGEYYLSALSGEWELVGSTSFTDEKLSDIFDDFYNTLTSTVAQEKAERISADDALNEKIENIASGIEEEISAVSSVIISEVETKYEELDGKLSTEKAERISADSAIREEIGTVSAEISEIIDSTVEELEEKIDGLSDVYATKEEIPLSTSQLINDSGFITEHQSLSDYYTKQEADDKFLTAHQDLTDYATKDYVQSEISDFITEDALTNLATKEEVQAVEDKLSDYAQLSDIPELPEDLVHKDDLSDYAQLSDIPELPEDLVHKDELSDYAQLSDIPDLTDTLSTLSVNTLDEAKEYTDEKIESLSDDYVSKTLSSEQTIKSTLIINGSENGETKHEVSLGANNSTAWVSVADVSGEVYITNDSIGNIDYSTGNGTELHFPSQNGTIATEEYVGGFGFALSDTVAEAYAVSIIRGDDENDLVYTLKQGNAERGTINIPKDQFLSDAWFDGTILVMKLADGKEISTDLSGLASQYSGDSGAETRISVGIENNTISAVLLDEYLKVTDAETLSNALSTTLTGEFKTAIGDLRDDVELSVNELKDEIEDLSNHLSDAVALSDYFKKSDLCAAILPNISQFNHYLSGDVPESISSVIEWNCALHIALLSCCGVLANYTPPEPSETMELQFEPDKTYIVTDQGVGSIAMNVSPVEGETASLSVFDIAE